MEGLQSALGKPSHCLIFHWMYETLRSVLDMNFLNAWDTSPGTEQGGDAVGPRVGGV